jgi:hypothetical protein
MIGGHTEHILLTAVSKFQCFAYGCELLGHPVVEGRYDETQLDGKEPVSLSVVRAHM